MLREDEDDSGSTGIVVIYDGRKRQLTVAQVGDSMCVLSRGGRAVTINKMHRVDDENEKNRVLTCGAAIMNNR